MIIDPLLIDPSAELPPIGPVRVPMPLTTLLGREKETADLVALMRRPDVRLVSLTGAGGIGKTRLAIEVANLLKPDFPGGQYYFSFHDIDSSDHVVPLILEVLRQHHAPDASEFTELAAALADQRILLVMNGMEHITEARRGIIRLLESVPSITGFITSRVPMRVRGEHEFPLEPLAIPREGMTVVELQQLPAVQLFLHRAQSVRPSFTLNERNAEHLIDVLQRLDGLPAAIELAAFRSRLFPLKAIRERMDSLLDFLSGGPHDLPTRLQSMRSILRWGYGLLDLDGQRIFRVLSVFEGAFSFEAATHVLVDEQGNRMSTLEVMDGLAQMVDFSVVTPVTLVTDDAGYRMPITTREFGRELLEQTGDIEAAQERVLRFYLMTMERDLRDIYGAEQPALLARADYFAGNIESSLRHARGKDEQNPTALRIATLLSPYWLLRGKASEGADMLQTFLDRARDVSDRERADAHRELGSLFVDMNQIDRAYACHATALELYERCGHRKGIVASWNNLGVVAMKRGDLAKARELLEQSLRARREDGQDGPLAQSLSDCADVELHEGNASRARELQEEAYRIHLRMGNRIGIVCDCVNLLTTALLSSSPRLDEDWYGIGSRFAEDTSDVQGQAQLKLTYGMLRLQEGESLEALADISDALRVIESSNSARLMMETLPLVAEICVRLGDDRMAAQIIGAASHRGAGADRFAWYRGKRRAREIDRGVLERLGAGEYNRFTMLGAYQRIDQTIQTVLELIAQSVAEQALRVDARTTAPPPAIQPLTRREQEVLALVAQGLGDRDIADTLKISSRTAMTHVANIMKKMSVHSRSAASELGIRLGLVSPPREDVANGHRSLRS